MGFAAIDGITLHYDLAGAERGIPLVLINSLGTDRRLWHEVLPLLTPRFRVLTYDKRGHGLSDAAPGPCSIDDHVADLLGLLRHCGIQRAVFCGISIGGMIAARFAARYPEQVERLILADTGAAIGTPETWNDRIAAVRAGGMAAVSDTILRRWVTPAFPDAQPAAFTGWRSMLERCPAAGYVASCASVRDADLAPDLPRIRATTLVLVGDGDVVTPPDMARRLADCIAGARLAVIRDAGHIPAIEQPQVLAGLITEHASEGSHV